jgi:hypothetical protein
VVSNGRLGDRRAELRFEIVGDLWATVATTQSLPLLNLGSGGLLVESADPLVVGSVQHLRLTIREEANEVGAAVKHVRPAPGKPDRYLVGLAFLDLPAAARQALESVISEHGSDESPSGEA